MYEIEKRLGVNSFRGNEIKNKINNIISLNTSVKRTTLIGVDNRNFAPNPESKIDIKIKLIEEDAILSVKYGSWHGDLGRKEYEVNFNSNNLNNLIEIISILSTKYFILLSTSRTIWKTPNLTYTLDQYKNIDKALFEIEATSNGNEYDIDQAFMAINEKSMNSQETISFIEDLNKGTDTQIDLDIITPKDLTIKMLKMHNNGN